MTYAPAHRAFYDADSHIMELPDFLRDYADPDMRDQIPPVNYSASIVTDEEVAVIVARGGRHSDEHEAELLALGDRLIESSKEIQALGAFDRAERTQALDMLGFKRQLVFATHSVALPFSPSSKMRSKCATARRARTTARWAAFCRNDARLMGVGVVPLDDPHAAIAELEHAIKQGLKAVWVPHRPCGDRSPGHDELDPFWARLAEAGVPFVLHVGGAPLQLNKAWIEQRPPADEGLARRRRERAQQGHRDPARRPRNVPEHDADRRRVRALPGTARRAASSSAPAGCRRC